MFSKEVLVSMLGGLLRLLLAGVSMWAVEKGIATQEQIGYAILGLAGFLGSVIWMWLNKTKARVELLTGLTAQPGTSVNELKDQIAKGCAVPASTPNDATPRAVQDNGKVTPPRGNMGAWLLPILLIGSLVTLPGCSGGTIKPPVITPPVITPDDQAQVMDIATKGLAGLEIAGLVMKKGQKLGSDLEKSGVIPRSVRTAINEAVITANDDFIQPTITKIERVVKKVGQLATVTDIKGWCREGIAGFLVVARTFEKQTDARLVMVGQFIRTALTVIGGLVGIEVTL